MEQLGKWAVIDIETTGIDESYDDIIDLGFLQFEGCKLVRKYSSLVKTDKPLSSFIQKLTGITTSMVKNAPLWNEVEIDLLSLEGHDLIAHNAAFEKKFLSPFFQNVPNREKEFYVDTLSFFGLVFPDRQKLGLEGLLVDFGIADQEMHRGYEDSLDLLKMMLFSLEFLHRDKEKKDYVLKVIEDLDTEYWRWSSFLFLSSSQWQSLASEIDFEVVEYVDRYLYKKSQVETEEYSFAKPLKGFNSNIITETLGEVGQVKEVFPDFKERESQKKMALRVGQSFGNSIHSIIQAPTGTGKTLAYLLPASLFAKDREQRVLVATGTKALQEQIMTKDIPRLRQIIGDKFSELEVVRLVGSSNHLCELLFKNNESQSSQMSILENHDGDFIEAYLKMVFFHNSRVMSEERILKDQIPYILKKIISGMSETLNETQVDFRSCIGSKCQYAHRCSYLQGLRDGQKADIIVGNHALMLHWPRGVERPRYVVVDEAHRMEQEASEAYSLSLEQKQFDYLIHLLDRGQGLGALFYLLIEDHKEHLVDELKETSLELNEKLKEVQKDLDFIFESYFKKSSRFTDIYWNELPMVESHHTDELGKALRNILVVVKTQLEAYYEMLSPYGEMFKGKQDLEDNSLTALAQFENLYAVLEDSYQVLKNLLEDSPLHTRQLHFHADFGYLLKVTPVDIGKNIKEQLLDEAESVVFTSATLANKDGTRGTLGVNWATGYSYLPSEKRFQKGLYLQGAFDYEKSTRVFLATDTPLLNSFDFIPHVVKKLVPTIEALGGKTLMLFSARKRFDQAVELMLQAMEGKMNVYVQGMGAQVVESFKSDDHGVLIGMESFGEGIDIPGESLQLVYIDKVPDVRMSLVTNARRTFFEEQFGNEFVDYYLAQRTRSLHQKLGRLLRTESDWGAVIITDSRLKRWKNRTVGQFRELMQPYDIQFTSLDDACRDALNFIQNY